jgi:hypothetical protein
MVPETSGVSSAVSSGYGCGVEDAFAIVLFVVVGLAAILAVVALVMSGGTYRQIGRGGLFEDDGSRPREDSGAVRDDDIRQMLTARNSLRAARGEDEVDVEAELAALTRPASEPALEAEVRQHVESRNRRRIARGLEPLDVDAEVERRLRGR